MTMLRLFATAALAGLTATAAVGENLRGSDPQSFMNFFFEEGFPAQLTTDAVGDPFIEFRVQGTTFPLWFYDCSENTDCESVQFYYSYELDQPVPLERLNEWNNEDRRFTRGYTPDGTFVAIEMDIFTGADGISQADFSSLVDIWFDRLGEFEEFIGW